MVTDGHGSAQFEDRTDAGIQLATAIAEQGIHADAVLAIPRGGLPLGRAVADGLGVPLDIVVASKIGAPNNSEFAIGAAASDGSVWLDRDTIERLDVSEAYVRREQEREIENARSKAAQYRGDRPPPDLRDKAVVIVDDGVATGSTVIAAARLVHEQGAHPITIAVPVGPPDTIAGLASEADEVICLATPSQFRAVGQFYHRFEQVTDEEAMEFLETGQ